MNSIESTTTRPLARWLRRGLAALALVAGQAQAAFYTGVWDPTFSNTFSGLGWAGSATYFVPDTCLPTGTADISNDGACDGAAQVTAAQVNFYDTSDPLMTTVATVVFNASSMIVDTLSFVDGVLSRLSSSASAFAAPDASLVDLGIPGGAVFSLQFDLLDVAHLRFVSCPIEGDFECLRAANDPVNHPITNFQITRVPAPGSIWLAGLALLALGWVRRPRRA